VWENNFNLLQDRTTISWDRFNVISLDPDKVGIVGKAFGHLLGYLAETGKVQMLSQHLNFARHTIRRPINVYPEWWYYQPLGRSHEYWDGFWQKYKGIWEAWTVDPEGDYTVDSGNCEQVSVFLGHFWEDLLGLEVMNGRLNLWPKLPFEFKTVMVKNAPVFHNQTVSYELNRNEAQTSIHLQRDKDVPLRLTLGMPASKEKIKLTLNDQPLSAADIRRQDQVQWISADLPANATADFKLLLS
jgi:hypothetical protein